MKKIRCFQCGNVSENWILKEYIRKYQGDGYSFELEVETPYCEKCGSPIYDRKIEQEIREKAHKMIQKSRKIENDNNYTHGERY